MVATGWNLGSAGYRETGFDSGKEWGVRKGNSSGDEKPIRISVSIYSFKRFSSLSRFVFQEGVY